MPLSEKRPTPRRAPSEDQSPFVQSWSCHECDEFARFFHLDATEATQIDRGRFSGRVVGVAFRDVRVIYGWHAQALTCTGWAPASGFVVRLDIAAVGRTFLNGEPMIQDGAFGVCGPGLECCSWSAASEFAHFHFRDRALHEAFQRATRRELAAGPGEFWRLKPAPESWQRLRETVLGIRERATKHPAAFEDPGRCRDTERDLLSALVHAIASGEARHCRPSRSCATARKAMNHLRQLAGRPASLADLARVAGVSKRTLGTAFETAYGTTPLRCIRQWRLQQVRQILRRSRPGETMVKVVALENGFRDLGRFSAYYREMFGEKPSETLLNWEWS
jgi:AraC-like DNA-binding protein